MTFYQNQLQPFSLAGAGAVSGATSIILKSMKDIDGNSLTMATSFGTKGYGTLEPGNNTLEEQISFTGLVNNANGTTTLTGVKSVTFGEPYTETSGLAKTHAGSSTFVISNTSGYYGEFAIKQNDEDITGYWNTPDPIDPTNIANRQWVLSVVNGGAVSQNAVIVIGNAGETVSAGQLVYLNSADGEWYKTDADASATTDFIQIGIAQGAGTNGNAITGGILIKGLDTNQSGLVAGTLYYVSNTAGGISSSAGTFSRVIGQAQSATTLYFDPYFKNSVSGNQEAALAGSSGTPSASNKYVTQADSTVLTPAGSFIPYAGRSALSGWLLCDGTAVSRATYANLFAVIAPSQTFTVTVATPAVFTANSHGLVIGDKISLTTTGSLPTGLTANTDYYVISAGYGANSFQVSTTRAGSAVNTTGSQSGVQTLYATNYGKGDGSTTFNVPDMRGYTVYGYKSSDANFDVLNVPNTYVGEKTHVITQAELPAVAPTITATVVTGGGGITALATGTGSGTSTTSSYTSSSNLGSGTAGNNMPPYVVANWLIKT
jgi:microcystin-dependent protein